MDAYSPYIGTLGSNGTRTRVFREAMMTTKVFISHAADDIQLATALVDLLFSCMHLDDEQVRCTSVPGHKLPVGSDVAKTLRDELGESSVVIGLLTPRSLRSSWVLFELGAAWGSHKNTKPLLSDDVDFSDLPGPLSGHHAVRLSDANGLIQLIDEVHQIVGVRKHSAAKVHAAVKKLTEVHSQIQAAVPKATSPKSVKTRVKEPTISGMPFSDLMRVLHAEKVTVPAHLAGTDNDQTISLLDALVRNYDALASGVHSTWDPDEPGGFLYYFVAVKLLPFQLVKYEKLPASRYYQRIVLSANGQKFIAHFKRLTALLNTDRKK